MAQEVKRELLDKLTIFALLNKDKWDELFYNKYTDTKPSDIIDEDYRLMAVVCLVANKAAWNESLPNQDREDHSLIFNEIRNFFYDENNEVDKKDISKFHRLID